MPRTPISPPWSELTLSLRCCATPTSKDTGRSYTPTSIERRLSPSPSPKSKFIGYGNRAIALLQFEDSPIDRFSDCDLLLCKRHEKQEGFGMEKAAPQGNSTYTSQFSRSVLYHAWFVGFISQWL
ncbi:hypothetical protein THAOC_10464 [Thalassiosira oceanica]|uniref:Uncharacterized protein n=1 Tax=Thalassiosira oceanica TaxID=159749 RepID=K0SPX8_THAOC|nr:hypothetical protein THAOC_10464 [Thalassiosira oceanica]|eukprot:EJK68358.1 hypothetical protein THAOC_10464 [Thalassiosira oceanica]